MDRKVLIAKLATVPTGISIGPLQPVAGTHLAWGHHCSRCGSGLGPHSQAATGRRSIDGNWFHVTLCGHCVEWIQERGSAYEDCLSF